MSVIEFLNVEMNECLQGIYENKKKQYKELM